MIKEDSRLKTLELLAPAANADVAREAILHGADAVYMGGPSHGARKAASNSIEDIRKTVEFAHIFRVRVYVTVNTIIYDSELERVERLAWDLYHAGVDALIVQDMALLRMNLPPIALHASTQCDNRDASKVAFLEKCGFSQVVLARELTLDEIREIRAATDVTLECFVHGALCVSYSGRCHASYVSGGRSANRGECGQICRLPYTLKDAGGKTVVRDRHLLSMKDFNASDRIPELIEAGAGSFKIEGRLKDAAYVKNVTAAYSKILDDYIAEHPGEFRRSSYGRAMVDFTPRLDKSFNRGFTHYFLDGKHPLHIASILTPKSQGEIITDPCMLNNGDGISFFDANGEYRGVNVNKVVDDRIFTARNIRIPREAELHRTFDIQWQQMMSRPTATRRLTVDMTLDRRNLCASDERGVSACVSIDADILPARKPMDARKAVGKLGNTPYELRDLEVRLSDSDYIPASALTDARRRLVEALDKANLDTYRFEMRREEDRSAVYPSERLDYRDNVANLKARAFYLEHGVKDIAPALEADDRVEVAGKTVMTTRHCILREIGMCKKTNPGRKLNEPLSITSGERNFRLRFDCSRCEMQVIV